MNFSQTDEKVLEIPVSMSELEQLNQRIGTHRKEVSVSKFDQNGKVNYSSSEEEDSRVSAKSPTKIFMNNVGTLGHTQVIKVDDVDQD